ncbi:MAG: fumarylacetoacetate hydrolase family protein [Alphaproteobacteria bacterium]|nr:fumarylacetoacetate hydrolase family protein [Alphaproteobacteria bacterium]
MPAPRFAPADILPEDADGARLVGRVWLPSGAGRAGRPVPVAVADGAVHDLSHLAPTVSALLASRELRGRLVAGEKGSRLFALDALLAEGHVAEPMGARPHLLAPIDLHCVKAAGVTFAISTIERVIEEAARGNPASAADIRARIGERIGRDLARLKPGSPQAAELKQLLIAEGLWSQYLEVAIGPYAEVFTKAPVLASVGFGADVGVRSDSAWNNPEPEVVLVVSPAGEIVGATLGNDVNHRDIEGMSALLLGKAKDNNASCSVGPFIRLVDEGFTLDDIRRAQVGLALEGEDGFRMQASSDMSKISRDIAELVEQTMGKFHQYPDGFVLFTGTLFAPVVDRDRKGAGFTHKVGDWVRISSPRLGMLANRVEHTERVAPWRFGIGDMLALASERAWPSN